MKFTIKKSSGIPFAKKEPYEYDGVKYEADLKNGDIVKILDGGAVEVGQFGEQNNFKVKTRNGDKKMSLNQSSINVLVQEFGEDSEQWIGKDAVIIMKKGIYAGKKGIATYLVAKGWTLDEYGDLVKEGSESKDNDQAFLDEMNERIQIT